MHAKRVLFIDLSFWLGWVWVWVLVRKVGLGSLLRLNLGLGDNNQKRVYVSERFFYDYLFAYGFMVKTNKDLMIVE